MKRIAPLFSLILLSFGCLMARADVKLAPLFTDDMVLQREKPVPVWGTADPQEKVVVSIGNQAQSTQADANGNWRVMLDAMPAAQDLTLAVQGNNRIALGNVAVSDVYLCSGQSNMEFGVGNLANANDEIAAANYPNIRLFLVPHKIAGTPQSDFAAPVSWKVCTPENIRQGGWNGFSAAAYFFGRALHQKLGIPIGLIDSSWGGTVAQAWTSRDTLLQRDDFRDATLDTEKALAAETAERPHPNRPTVLYNGMIAPLVPFAVRGVIWYQGESNAGQPAQYRTLFPDLIRDWRTHWNARQDGSEFGFYFVQLANFMARTDEPVQSGWAELRDAQTHTLQVVPRTGMATIIDIGEANNIHPKDKQDVGKRLALAALAKEYGQNIEYSGPMFYLMEMEAGSNKVRIHFTHALGLTVKNASSEITAETDADSAVMPHDHWVYNALGLFEKTEIFPTFLASKYSARSLTRYEFALAVIHIKQTVNRVIGQETTNSQVGPVAPVKLSTEQSNALSALKDEFAPELRALGIRTGDNLTSRISGDRVLKVAPHMSYDKNNKPLPNVSSPAIAPSSSKLLNAVVKGFAIQDSGGKWHAATARIEGESVVVWNDEVLQPKAVAYAWANNPDVNLVNAAGLPAVSFRTDIR
jgi:sialate O-acetylesterase